MREILFRGKTISNNSLWVEGFYNHIPCGRFLCDEHCIQTIEEDGRIGHLFDVYESTVGQFTGLTDKNGTKIFEGDIVAYCWYDAPMNFRIDYVSGEFLAVPVETREDVWALRISGQGESLEVIGNIHDNPELLGGED